MNIIKKNWLVLLLARQHKELQVGSAAAQTVQGAAVILLLPRQYKELQVGSAAAQTGQEVAGWFCCCPDWTRNRD